MTLSAAIPGYDPDFFGALGEDVGAKIGAAAASSGGGGPISSLLPPPGQVAVVDYAFKCGQGATIYRCYGIGKVSHATLVDLQHQVNRLAGKHVIAEDGILGPATLNAVRLIAASTSITGLPEIDAPTTLDDMAAAAPQLVRQYRAAADQKYGAEPREVQAKSLISSIKSASKATAHEVSQDKRSGAVPAGFTQDLVRASQKAIADIGARLGAAAAAAAAAADQIGTTAGPVERRNTKLYVGVGLGLTAAAALAIVLIATHKPRKRKAA